MSLGRIRNWSEFQHYKDRSPPWIKFHRALLDNYEYACLPLASKALAPLLWLLAAESNDGSLRVEVPWIAFRLRWSEADVAAGLTPLIEKGFIEGASEALADCKQVAIPELEGETEGELEREGEKKATPDGVAGDSAGVTPPLGDDDTTKAEACPLRAIVGLYHETLPELPHVEKITKTRAGYLRQRWREDLPDLDSWRRYFADIRGSPYLMGKKPGTQGRPPFIASLEWITNPTNFAKIAEGNYHRG